MLIYVYICHTFVGCIQHHSPLGFRDVGGQGPKMTPSDCYRPKSMGAKLKDSIDLNVGVCQCFLVQIYKVKG